MRLFVNFFQEAKTVLAWLRGVSTLDSKVEEEVEGIVKAEKRTQSDSKSVWGIIRKFYIY